MFCMHIESANYRKICSCRINICSEETFPTCQISTEVSRFFPPKASFTLASKSQQPELLGEFYK